MRFKLPIFKLIPTGILVATSGFSSPVELSLEDAFRRATVANYEYLIERQNVDIAKQALRVEQSNRWPDLSLNSSQSRSLSSRVGTATGGLNNLPNRQYINRFEAVLRSRFELLNFRIADSIRSQRIQIRISENELENAIQSILEGIGDAYFDYWRNLRRMELIEARIERSLTLLDIAKSREETGVATPLDVTRAEVDLQENELEKLQQQTRLLESELTLKRILAFPLNEEIRLQNTYLESNTPQISITPELIEKILVRRNDYQALKSELEQFEIALSATRRERLPSVALTGEWGYASETISDDMEEQWLVGIGVDFPIFEGFRTQASEQADRARIDQATQRLKELREQIEAELRIALQDRISRAQQVEVARKNLKLNQQEFELATLRFEEGVADNSDVVDAQVGLATAEDRLIESEYFYFLSQIRWARVSGDTLSVLN